MHGLINTAIQSFLKVSFGDSAWSQIAHLSGVTETLGPEGFEAMQLYEDDLTYAVLDAAAAQLERPRESLLEDIGTFLISNEMMNSIRRLLRFGGVSFTDFLFSLDDLQGRSQLAVPELLLPELMLEERAQGTFSLSCIGGPDGFGHVMIGILRAIADDYGALVVLDYADQDGKHAKEIITIDVYDPAFQPGRHFDLTQEVR